LLTWKKRKAAKEGLLNNFRFVFCISNLFQF